MKPVFIVILLLCISTICFSEYNYYDEYLDFGFNVPDGWELSFKEDWPEEIKLTIQLYDSSKIKTVLLCKPAGVEHLHFPFIWIKVAKSNFTNIEMLLSNERIISAINNDKKFLPNSNSKIPLPMQTKEYITTNEFYKRINEHIAMGR